MSLTSFVQKNSFGKDEYTDSGLLFLAHHSTAHAKALGFPLLKSGTDAYDVPATLTLVNDPSGQKVHLKVIPTSSTVAPFEFYDQYSFYNMKLPDIAGREGTLFLRGTAPSGENTFWIQQYPPYIGGEGRLVVEFWNKEGIQAVFKSDDNNFGAMGTGSWGQS